MKKLFKHSGTSLIETLLASVIFVLSVAGIYATMAAMRKPVASNNRGVEAAVLSKQILEDLRAKVDARDWDGVNWSLGIGTHNINSPTYRVTYWVTYVDPSKPSSSGRKVDIQVNWTDLP